MSHTTREILIKGNRSHKRGSTTSITSRTVMSWKTRPIVAITLADLIIRSLKAKESCTTEELHIRESFRTEKDMGKATKSSMKKRMRYQFWVKAA
jgi:hypothetical protein